MDCGGYTETLWVNMWSSASSRLGTVSLWAWMWRLKYLVHTWGLPECKLRDKKENVCVFRSTGEQRAQEPDSDTLYGVRFCFGTSLSSNLCTSCLAKYIHSQWRVSDGRVTWYPIISDRHRLVKILKTCGGGGFFLVCEDFGRVFENSFPACTFFFFLKWRLVCAY